MPNVSREDIGALNAVLTVEIQHADYWPAVEKKLKEYRQKGQFKGFRPGQVPMAMVKRQVGKSLLLDQLNEVMDAAIQNYVKENGIEYIAQPLPIVDEKLVLDLDKPKTYSFKFELGLAPEIEVKGISPDSLVPFYDIEVAEEVLDEEIERLRRRLGNGHEENVEDIKLGDIVVADLTEKADASKKGKAIEKADAYIAVDRIADEALKAAFLAAKVGDTLEIADVFKLENAKKDNIRRYLLGVTAKTVVNPAFSATIKEVKRIAPAELNQEFYSQVFPEDQIENSEDFRKRLEAEVKKSYHQTATQQRLTDIFKFLSEENSFELPETFLKRWLREGQNAAPEVIEAEFENFLKDIRWSLMRASLAKKYNVEIQAEDLEHVFRSEVLRYYNYQVAPYSPMVNDLVKQLMSDRRAVQQRYENLMDQQVLLAASEEMGKEVKAISLEDFKALQKAEETEEVA